MSVFRPGIDPDLRAGFIPALLFKNGRFKPSNTGGRGMTINYYTDPP